MSQQKKERILIIYQQLHKGPVRSILEGIESAVADDCCTPIELESPNLTSEYLYDRICSCEVLIYVYSYNGQIEEKKSSIITQCVSYAQELNRRIVLITLDKPIVPRYLSNLYFQQITDVSNVNTMQVLYDTLRQRIVESYIKKRNALPKSNFQIGNLYYQANNDQVIVTDYDSEVYDYIDIPNAIKYGGYTYEVVRIAEKAFESYEKMQTITIPSSVTHIENSAFYNCLSLNTIHIPNSVKYIAENAFAYCKSLESISIPSSVNNIGFDVLKACPSLLKISVNSDNAIYDSRNDCNAIIQTNTNTLLAGCKKTKIPNGVEVIGKNAFFECSSLISLIVPKSVRKISEHAFCACSSLDSLIISEGVEIVEKRAFSGCSSLITMIIPDSVERIGDYAFSGCSSLTSINLPHGLKVIEAGTFADCSSLSSIIIPDGVTSIECYAFSDCSSLTSVVIPNSVVKIGDSAFEGCSSLVSIFIPNSVIKLGDEECLYDGCFTIFRGCVNLRRIYIPYGTKQKFAELLSRSYRDLLVEIEES